jgi:ATP-dependent Clp protease adapter protein ClpS
MSQIQNFSLNQPHGAVVIDIASYQDQATNRRMYNSVLTFFLDQDGATGISIMTDVHSDTYTDCLDQTLRHVCNVFASIGAESTVFDVKDHSVIRTLDLNELYPNGFDATVENMPEERPKYLH